MQAPNLGGNNYIAVLMKENRKRMLYLPQRLDDQPVVPRMARLTAWACAASLWLELSVADGYCLRDSQP